jgi:hypothetical protein
MREIRQKIFPVCSFGRSENVFYQSKNSLCAQDLSGAEILSLIEGQKEPLFPSHILDRTDWEHLLTEIPRISSKPRVQVALGREWEELSARILKASTMGWGVDIFADRPLTMLVTPEDLSKLPDWRWIACPLRFFNPAELWRSLARQGDTNKQTLLCFLEPRNKATLLLNPDEVILAKEALRETLPPIDYEGIPLLLMQSSRNAATGFYQNPTLEMYQDHFAQLGEKRGLRFILKKSFKNFPQAVSQIFYFGSLWFRSGFKLYWFFEYQYNKRVRMKLEKLKGLFARD